MKQAFREKLLKVGVLDTRKYHYEVFHMHALSVIKRIKRADIRSWNIDNDQYWESVEYICY